MLDEAIQDEAAYAGRGSRMRPTMLDEAIQYEAARPPMLDEAPMLDETTIDPNHDPEFS